MLRKLLLVLLFLAAPAWCEAPRVFQKLDFATASSQAKEKGRWLLVDATATWCPPCHKMDATTWVDPQLEGYFEQKILAIQIDVDEQSELAEKLGISAMPTVIVFGPDGELDRSVGYKTSEELLAWLRGLAGGKTQADSLREKAATGDIESRYDLAGVLLEKGKLQDAEDLYLQLWDDMRDTEWSGVRLSYMLSSMGELAEKSPPAKERMEKLRQKAFQEGKLDDWFHLSRTLGLTDELLAWEPATPMDPTVEKPYFDFLVEAGQLAKAGRLLKDPAGSARDGLAFRATLLESLDAEMRQQMEEYAKESTRQDLLNLYGACRAAGRAKEAQEVRKIATDDDPELKATFDDIDTQLTPLDP